MRETRFVFVEGLMGAGKTTLVERLVRGLREAGVPAVPVWEGPTLNQPHQPLRISPTLPHPFAPWDDLTIEQYVAESVCRWQSFASTQAAESTVVVCDGLLFHGNMTDLMLMGASYRMLRGYVLDVVGMLGPLSPVVVYLRRPDVAEALHTIAGIRGKAWQDYQVEWKVNSPYGRAHELEGFAGLIQFYHAYRGICDSIFQVLPIPRLVLDHTGDWDVIYRHVSEFIGIQIDSGTS